MAKKAIVLGGATGTGSTTSITSSGFGTPDGAILLFNESTADGADSGSDTLSIVFWDGTTTVCRTASDQDAVGTMNTASGLYTGQVRLVRDGGTLDAQGAISATTDGISIAWSNVPDASRRYTAVLFGGGVSLKVGTLQMSGTLNGTAVYSSAAFTPQAGLFISSGSDTLNTGDNDALFSLGAFTYRNATLTQRVLGYKSASGVGTSVIDAYASNAHVHAYPGSGEQAEITAVSSSGFTVTTRNLDYAAHLGFLLIGGIGDVYLGDTPIPTATGSKAWTAPGFRPDLVMMGQSGIEAYGGSPTGEDAGWTFGVSDGSAARCLAGWSGHALGTSNTSGRQSASLLQSVQTGFGQTYSASLTGFTSTGWDMNYSAINVDAQGEIGFSLALQFVKQTAGGALFMGAGI